MSTAWATVAEELLAVLAPVMAPPSNSRILALALDLEETGSVLIVGDRLPQLTRSKLKEQFVLRHVSSLGEALEAMDGHAWNLVIVSPRVHQGTDGLRFVRAFKASTPPGIADELRRRYARVPFLIQPLPNDTQFAVFKTADEWYLADTTAITLTEAIRRWCR